MNATVLSPVDTLLEAAKRLTNREQGEFLDRFLDLSYDGADGDEEQPLSPEWKAEIEQRIADDEAGLTQWHPLEDVLAEARESLKRPA
ncbi:MAG: addiction module protein [Verrucomicrobiaceae bacterium]|jgi:hypothetical protein|nr:addiction module protein [Verrucomicrobiaceae bacterium]